MEGKKPNEEKDIVYPSCDSCGLLLIGFHDCRAAYIIQREDEINKLKAELNQATVHLDLMEECLSFAKDNLPQVE